MFRVYNPALVFNCCKHLNTGLGGSKLIFDFLRVLTVSSLDYGQFDLLRCLECVLRGPESIAKCSKLKQLRSHLVRSETLSLLWPVCAN